MNKQLALWVMFVLVMTQPEIEGSETNDSELQTCDSQDDSEDDAQADCSPFYKGRLRPEVQTLTLLYTSLNNKGTPFAYYFTIY